jgi:MFS family permease
MGNEGSNLLEPGDHRHRVISWVLIGLATFFLIPVTFFYVVFFMGGRTAFEEVLILAALLLTAYVLFRVRWGTIARGWGQRVWMIAGLLMLAALLVLAAALTEPPLVTPYPISDATGNLLNLAFISLPAIVVIYSALLVKIGMSRAQERVDKGTSSEGLLAGRMSSGMFILIALLLGLLLYDLYWLAIWDSTTDSLDYFWIIGPVLTAVFAGVLLASLMPWKIKWTGLCYALLIPALLIGVFYSGKQQNIRQLTESRAASITRAIEAYYSREGRYPQQLSQLTPWSLLLIPSPVIIQGGNWCYQAGADYYRLGYLDRDHWSSPIVFGRMYSAKGHSPLKVDVCQQAIDNLRTRYNWDAVLQEYGKPTPTPDLGE